ncbi:MAG: serine/threonine protein kinase [Acidobacteria bacterium]|jgi:serine/threonine-protein kinase PpkA|nr:serine/threonine protein kinase [Acidobacteriota bacterium]
MAAFPEVPGYELKKFLGSGGAADVFLAVDRRRSRLAAVKVLARRRFAETVAVRRFIKEAQTISRLHHPNIVRVYETGRTAELRFMAMEFFPESLKRRLQERGRLAPDEALTIASQVAAALFYAHDRGFIHRDVKPDNIMFRTDGTPVILDFGIARVIESTTQLTRSGMALGTPRYMSPEQLNAKRVDGRSDVYSLGVVLYEMLSGAPPFKGSQTMAVIMKHVTEPVPPLPAELAAFQPLVDRLMAKERAKRPGTEKEWQELVKPLFKPLKLPKAGKPEFGDLAKIADRDSTLQSGGPVAKPLARPKPRRRPRPLRRFVLNLLLVLAVSAWLFFNYERIPGMLLSLWRAIVAGVSSLAAKL